MKIYGLQTLTLLDYPEKTACTVFTKGCNLRCPFCHNAGLVVEENEPLLQENEFMDFLDKRRGKLDGVCISGGEPLLQSEVYDFAAKVKAKGFLVKLDTNGTFPQYLEKMIKSKNIDYVAMDIKNVPEKYMETAGCGGDVVERVKESVAILMNGNIDYEFRTTVVKEYHDIDDINKIGEWICGADKYYLQKFRDSGNLICKKSLHAHSDDVMEKMLGNVRKYVKNAELRG